MVNKPQQQRKAAPPAVESGSEIIAGKLMYAKLNQPDTYKGASRWTVDLLLDSEGLKRAKALNLRIKKVNKKGEAAYADKFPGYDGSFLRLTRNTHTRTGEPMEPPRIMDAKRNVVSPATTMIGNGSDAKVKMYVKRDISAEDFEQFGGYKAYLNAVQIINLVQYDRSSGPDSDFFDEEGSFEAPPAAPAAKGQKASAADQFDWENGDDPPFDVDPMRAG